MAMVPNVLFDKPVLVMAAPHRVGQMEVFNHGLPFAGVALGDLTTKDYGEFIGLADCSVAVEPAVA
jgi:hypothetical protein